MALSVPELHTPAMCQIMYSLYSSPAVQVFESHQSSKKDTSGTAKAVVASFNRLGLQFDESQVRHD
jgi:hypothetical protein